MLDLRKIGFQMAQSCVQWRDLMLEVQNTSVILSESCLISKKNMWVLLPGEYKMAIRKTACEDRMWVQPTLAVFYGGLSNYRCRVFGFC
jgi:hypothetical protein